MEVRVVRFLDGAREARGRAVIVDVFRAFTTAAFCVAAGAREVVLLADHERALAMKADDPSVFLTGEIGGRPISGFDVGNSPSKIVELDLSGRRRRSTNERRHPGRRRRERRRRDPAR